MERNKWIKIVALVVMMFLLSQCVSNQRSLESIDFKKLQVPQTPNYFLACPSDYCEAEAQLTTHAYTVSSQQLQKSFTEIILRQPRTKILRTDALKQQVEYQQRSLIFRFPDFITVQFISLSDHSSTLAVFSRSKYGYSDLGVNKKRIESWLQQLDNVLNPLLRVHPRNKKS